MTAAAVVETSAQDGVVARGPTLAHAPVPARSHSPFAVVAAVVEAVVEVVGPADVAERCFVVAAVVVAAAVAVVAAAAVVVVVVMTEPFDWLIGLRIDLIGCELVVGFVAAVAEVAVAVVAAQAPQA